MLTRRSKRAFKLWFAKFFALSDQLAWYFINAPSNATNIR
jgi:hypothetical protein